MAAACVAAALTAGVVSVPTASAEDLKHRQSHVKSKIKHAQDDLHESSGRLRRAAAALEAARVELDSAKAVLASARVKLEAAKVRDQEMQARLAGAEERLEGATQDLDDGRVALEDQRGVVTDTITSIYQQGDPQLLAFSSLLEANSPADLTRGRELQSAVVGRETRAYDDLRAAEVLLEVREDQVQAAKDAVAVQRRAAARHLVTMRELRGEAQQARAAVRAKVNDRRDARADAAKARQKDRAQLVKLRKKERQIKQRILRAARRAARAAARRNHGSPRVSADGFLSRPVPGIVTSSYGYRIHPIYRYYGLHNGTDFRAPCGTALRAVSGGRVISKYYSSVYGNRLHVGLGLVNGRYLTAVYNHARRYTVGVGQTVRRGQVLGYAGTTGWSTACHLHFEVLVGGRPINPMNWM